MTRDVMIGGVKVRLRASALIPRLYRIQFGRDMVVDMRQLRKSYLQAEAVRKEADVKDLDAMTAEEREALQERIEDAQLSATDLAIFENVAWLMARHGAEYKDVVVNGETKRLLVSGDMPVFDDPEEWLDSLDGVFSIYEVMPDILELWGANLQTTSIPAKK